jgi:hypothetical protein
LCVPVGVVVYAEAQSSKHWPCLTTSRSSLKN